MVALTLPDEIEITDRLYGPWELQVTGWSDFLRVSSQLGRMTRRPLVWRGARRAEWGLTSSLYRLLRIALGKVPTEDELVNAERVVLDSARKDWRFDHMPALELFAHIQHYGGPTRMLDVTFNPMIALWFAVEEHRDDDIVDGRLFAFGSSARDIQLNSKWYGRHPYWHTLVNDAQRQSAMWGTGEQRRIWRPPAFNERIASQNAAFLIDGAPLANATHPLPKVAIGGDERWDVEELRLVSSLNFRPNRMNTRSLHPGQAPAFTIRVHAEAKGEVRRELEQRFGIRASSIYSDLSGLATFLAGRPEQLLDKVERSKS